MTILGRRHLEEEATVVPEAKNKISRCVVVYLGKALQKLFRIDKYSSGNGFFLESFHVVEYCQQSRGGTFSHVMLRVWFWNEKSGESEGRKINVRTSFGVRTQVYSLIVNK